MAGLALPAVLALVVLAGLILVVPDGTLVDCERDGHFQRAGALSCGLITPNAPYGPLLPWLVAPLIPLVGTPYLAARGLSLIALLGLVVLSWRAARLLGAGPGAAALAGLLVGVNGPMLFYGSMACSDLPAAALYVLACWLALRGLAPCAPSWSSALAGMALASACLVRVQFYLPAVVMLAVWPLAVRRLRPGLTMLAGFGLPVALAAGVGLWRYGNPADALEQQLGLAAYARNLVRAGSIIGQAGGDAGVVPLGDRLLWSTRLVWRCTGGLPLLGAVGALALALRRRRWAPALVLVAPALALYVGLAWSHPPPDWGARRFYLYLVPLCAVPSVLLGRMVLVRLSPVSRGPALVAALLAGGLAVAHGLWEIRSFRAPQLSSLLKLEAAGPRGMASSYERGVVREAARLGTQLEACVPVATNFHPAATVFHNAWFVGDVALDGEAAWAEAIPRRPDAELWLLWVEPGGASPPVLRRVLAPAVERPALRGAP